MRVVVDERVLHAEQVEDAILQEGGVRLARDSFHDQREQDVARGAVQVLLPDGREQAVLLHDALDSRQTGDALNVTRPFGNGFRFEVRAEQWKVFRQPGGVMDEMAHGVAPLVAPVPVT